MKSPRRHAISTLTAVSLVATTACFDKPDDDDDDDDGGPGDATEGSIIGTWSLERLEYDGDVYTYPYVYSSGGYSYTTGMRMKIRSEEAGDSYFYTEYSYADGSDYFNPYSPESLTITKTAERRYDIQFDEEGLLMSCELGGSRLDCTGPSWEGYGEIDWVRLD